MKVVRVPAMNPITKVRTLPWDRANAMFLLFLFASRPVGGKSSDKLEGAALEAALAAGLDLDAGGLANEPRFASSRNWAALQVMVCSPPTGG